MENFAVGGKKVRCRIGWHILVFIYFYVAFHMFGFCFFVCIKIFIFVCRGKSKIDKKICIVPKIF